jgi:hypothetical protein
MAAVASGAHAPSRCRWRPTAFPGRGPRCQARFRPTALARHVGSPCRPIRRDLRRNPLPTRRRPSNAIAPGVPPTCTRGPPSRASLTDCTTPSAASATQASRPRAAIASGASPTAIVTRECERGRLDRPLAGRNRERGRRRPDPRAGVAATSIAAAPIADARSRPQAIAALPRAPYGRRRPPGAVRRQARVQLCRQHGASIPSAAAFGDACQTTAVDTAGQVVRPRSQDLPRATSAHSRDATFQRATPARLRRPRPRRLRPILPGSAPRPRCRDPKHLGGDGGPDCPTRESNTATTWSPACPITAPP